MNPIKSHGPPADTSPDFAGLSAPGSLRDSVLLRLANGEFRARGQSNHSFNGALHPIAWIDDDASDSAALFQALTHSYGERLSNAVAQGFGFSSAWPEAISQDTAREAVNAAEVGLQALAGVDFLTRLEVSAAGNGCEFRRVCKSLGLSPESLTPDKVRKVDQTVSFCFIEAARGGKTPVEPSDASKWVKDALSVLTI